MGLLDALIYGYRQVLDSANNVYPTRSRLRILGGTVADNQMNDTTDVTTGGGGGGSAAGPTIDNTSTGAINAAPSTAGGSDAGGVRFTGAAPALAGLDPGSGSSREVALTAFGGPLILRNEGGGATAAWRILTGTGADVTLAIGQSVIVIRDTQGSRWRVVGAPSTGGASAGTAGQVQTGDGAGAFLAPGPTLTSASMQFGTPPTTPTGVVRVPNNTTALSASNAAGTASLALVSTDTSNTATVGNAGAATALVGTTVSLGPSLGAAVMQVIASAVRFAAAVGGFAVPLQMRSTSLTFAGADITLSPSQAECPRIKLVAGSGGSVSIIAPDVESSIYFVDATGSGMSPTIKKSGGTGVVCPSSKITAVLHNGTDYKTLFVSP